MTVFGDIGGFVRLGAVWFPGGRRGAEYGGHFLIRFSEPSEYGSWQGVGEVERSWSLVRSKGWIALEPWAVDEAVRVSRWGRYRGLPVIQFGPVKDNTLAVSPESYDPRAGRDDDHVHG